MWALLFTFFSFFHLFLFFPLFCCLGRPFLAVSRPPLPFSSFGNSRPTQRPVLKTIFDAPYQASSKAEYFFFHLCVVSRRPCPDQVKPLFFCRCTGERPCAVPHAPARKGWPSALLSAVSSQLPRGQARTGTQQAGAETSRHPKKQS